MSFGFDEEPLDEHAECREEIRRLVAEVERSRAEIRRLEHVIDCLRSSINMTAHTSETILDHVRVRDGRIEVWCLGHWLDLEREQAQSPDADGGGDDGDG